MMLKTTTTRVEKLRAEAKTLSKSLGQQLAKCLDAVARAHGYSSWKHVTQAAAATRAAATSAAHAPAIPASDDEDANGYFSRLEKNGLAGVQYRPVKGDVFLDLTIEGQRFQGCMTGGGPIVIGGRELDEWVQIGPSTIALVNERHEQQVAEYMAICKYDDQPRVSLEVLSSAGVNRLAVEFGLVLTGPAWSHLHEHSVFYESKGFEALVRWVRAHPRMWKRCGNGDYLFELTQRVNDALRPKVKPPAFNDPL